MIDISKTEVTGWEAAIRGMRNPMNSWALSDTIITDNVVSVGERDAKLMKSLASSGSDHRKYLRMITVTLDILAPLYWWKEFDTYKVGTVANSCSTMHKLADKAFDISDFSHEHLLGDFESELQRTIDTLNSARSMYIKTAGDNKLVWWQMIQLLPSSYNQLRTVQLNYEVLSNIYHSRRHHKLDEWRDFCQWIESLPHSGLITNA